MTGLSSAFISFAAFFRQGFLSGIAKKQRDEKEIDFCVLQVVVIRSYIVYRWRRQMLKEAATTYPILDIIAHRWSSVAFSNRMIEKEKLQSIFEAARWAPSSYNEQPWHFIIATKDDPEGFAKLLSCLVEDNIEWAQHAPVLMMTVAKLNFERNGKPNRHAFHDVGLAAENMVLQATSMGLMAHQMAGIKPEKVGELFGVPQGYEAVTGIALGYEGDVSFLSPELKQRQLSPRQRKPLEQCVFTGRWGNKSGIINNGT